MRYLFRGEHRKGQPASELVSAYWVDKVGYGTLMAAAMGASVTLGNVVSHRTEKS